MNQVILCSFVITLLASNGWTNPPVELIPGFVILAEGNPVEVNGEGPIEIFQVDLSNNQGFHEARIALSVVDESGEIMDVPGDVGLTVSLYRHPETEGAYYSDEIVGDLGRCFSVPLRVGIVRLRLTTREATNMRSTISVVANPRRDSYFGRELTPRDLRWYDSRYNCLHTNGDNMADLYEDPDFRSIATLGDLRYLYSFDPELMELFDQDCKIRIDDGEKSCIQTPADLTHSILRGHFSWNLTMENIEPPKIDIHGATATITSRKKMIGPSGGFGGTVKELERWKQAMTVEVQDGKIVATEMTMEMEELEN